MSAAIKEQLTSIKCENSNSVILSKIKGGKQWRFGQEVDPLMRAAAALTCSLRLTNGVRLLCLL